MLLLPRVFSADADLGMRLDVVYLHGPLLLLAMLLLLLSLRRQRRCTIRGRRGDAAAVTVSVVDLQKEWLGVIWAKLN